MLAIETSTKIKKFADLAELGVLITKERARLAQELRQLLNERRAERRSAVNNEPPVLRI